MTLKQIHKYILQHLNCPKCTHILMTNVTNATIIIATLVICFHPDQNFNNVKMSDWVRGTLSW